MRALDRRCERPGSVKTLLLLLLLAWPPLAFAQDRVNGLLSLPEVFGNGPCDRFTPREVLLCTAPESESPPPVFVFARRPGWFQAAIRSNDFDDWRSERRVWIQDTSAWRFNPVRSDAERERLAHGSWGPEFDDVRVVESRRVGDELWFHVEFLDHSECRGPDAPTVVRRGWIPAHSRSGKATVWFSSRGC